MVLTLSRSKTSNFINELHIYDPKICEFAYLWSLNSDCVTAVCSMATCPDAAPAPDHSQLSRTLVYKTIIVRSIRPRTELQLKIHRDGWRIRIAWEAEGLESYLDSPAFEQYSLKSAVSNNRRANLPKKIRYDTRLKTKRIVKCFLKFSLHVTPIPVQLFKLFSSAVSNSIRQQPGKQESADRQWLLTVPPCKFGQSAAPVNSSSVNCSSIYVLSHCHSVHC